MALMQFSLIAALDHSPSGVLPALKSALISRRSFWIHFQLNYGKRVHVNFRSVALMMSQGTQLPNSYLEMEIID
jgi:hypothetical protein